VIKVPATFTLTSQITGGDQFPNDSLGLTLGYVQGRRDISQARARVARDQEQRVAMIGQQPKVGLWVRRNDVLPTETLSNRTIMLVTELG
jgi:hypothetical protein